VASHADAPQARAFANAYAVTASALVAGLRDLSRPQPRMEPGTPHPDPQLAARGWEVGAHGIYTRTGRRQADHELEAG
jgi:hypothetical protein